MRSIKIQFPAILFMFSFVAACSMGKVPLANQQNDHLKNVKDYTIQFDKMIETNFAASGTLSIQKKGDYLILYDSHVSEFRLACIEYATGKEVWKVPYEVRGYWCYGDKILVEGYNSMEMIELKTGKSLWKMDKCVMHFQYGEGTELGDKVSVVYNENNAILDLKTKTIENEGGNIVGAFLFKQDIKGRINCKGIVVENKYGLSDKFYRVNVVEDRETAKDIYVWTLDPDSRTFTLSIYGHNDVLFKKHSWNIPVSKYNEDHDRRFSGLPEPEKLHGEVHCIGDQIFFYESYENYRWSWGRGCNRITAVDLYTHEINYQVWGQAPEEQKFHGFHFFDDVILQSDGTMHIQEDLSTFAKFDMKNGKVLDTLPTRFTLFKQYLPGILLGFNYESKQIKENEYTRNVSITAWDHIKDEYSKTFDFDLKEQFVYWPNVADDGTIIFDYYDKNLKKDVLFCCKIVIK